MEIILLWGLQVVSRRLPVVHSQNFNHDVSTGGIMQRILWARKRQIGYLVQRLSSYWDSITIIQKTKEKITTDISIYRRDI